MSDPIRVTVWNEYRHEKANPEIAKIYPDGIQGAIAEYLRELPDLEVRTATLDEPEHGLTEETLEATDVLTWWGHRAHSEVDDAIVERFEKAVFEYNQNLIMILLRDIAMSAGPLLILTLIPSLTG